ncbi:MAG: DNA adenine methylase [Anaerolineae bacterium]|nr:DNA adenine methylase [Anaerolineae bacterium]
MKIPHPIPYQGSKRNIAKFILPFFPREINTLIEPFAGSAAISIAAACHGKAPRFHLNDINKPLMALWQEIISDPKGVVASYERLWKEQQGKEREFYDYVRDAFNRTQRPDYLLYLLARCVKASVRYNARGEFNQSPDNRRLGRHPEQMADDIFAVSNLFRGRVTITSKDYMQVLESATMKDLVYLDPPYQGVCNNGDPRYYSGVDFKEFVLSLDYLNQQKIPFVLSYDGRTGPKTFGTELPSELELHQFEIEAGRSTQSTLLGKADITYESIYLSKALVECLDVSLKDLANKHLARQVSLFEIVG